jgi:SAM-dependent methyltransferase
MTTPEYRGSRSRSGVGYRDYLADEHNRVLEARGRAARDIIPLIPSSARVLEIGCATGSLLSVLAEQGYDATGIDFSELFVETCRRLYGVQVVCGDVLQVESRQDWFDAILLFGTISNLRNLGSYLCHFRRLLKPTGRLIFNFPDASSSLVRYVYRSHYWMFSPSVSCFMTGAGCAKALDAQGLQIDTFRTDMQQPSVSKLFHHARLGALDSLFRSVGLDNAISPWAFPVPAVRFVVASARPNQDSH